MSEPPTPTPNRADTTRAQAPIGPGRGLRLLLAALPFLLVPLAFVAILRSGDPAPFFRDRIPREAYQADRCTWHCHNHGCRHAPLLPPFFTGDRGLYGRTIDGLRRMGRGLARGGRGYGAANLLVFCLAWPGLMYALYLIALRQRLRLHTRRRVEEQMRADLAKSRGAGGSPP